MVDDLGASVVLTGVDFEALLLLEHRHRLRLDARLEWPRSLQLSSNLRHGRVRVGLALGRRRNGAN